MSKVGARAAGVGGASRLGGVLLAMGV